jgi:hypothetical protein
VAEYDLCNEALGLIGQAPITSADFSTPTTNVGRLCAMYYPRVRDSLLRKFPWQFASKRIALLGSDVQRPVPDILSDDCSAISTWTDADQTNGVSVLDSGHWDFGFSAPNGAAHRYKTLSWPEWGITKVSLSVDLKLGGLSTILSGCYARVMVIFGHVAIGVCFTNTGIYLKNHDDTYTLASDCSADSGVALGSATRARYTFDVTGTYDAASEDESTAPYGSGLVDIYKDNILMKTGADFTYIPLSSWLKHLEGEVYAAPAATLPVCSVALYSYGSATDMLVYGLEVGTSMKSVPAYGFAFAYPLPSDHMRTVAIDSSDYDFVLEDQRIMTDAPSIGLNYIAKVTDTTLYPDDFKDALTSRLAAKLAIPITQQPDLVGQLYKVHGLDMQEAHKVQPAFKQELPGKLTDSWIKARK